MFESSTLKAQTGTLEEPISETIKREFNRIGTKIARVLYPRGVSVATELRNWDLWGPLFLTLLLSITMSWSAGQDQSARVFAVVFVLVWCGAGIVTINATLLGGSISFFQSVCVLGYCIVPLNISSIMCHLWENKIYQFILVMVSFFWATRASVSFMYSSLPESRRLLGVYPVFLFYLTLSWMILVQ